MRLTGVEKYETGNTWATYDKNNKPRTGADMNVQVADFEFYVIGRGTTENDYFFASTPQGSMKFSVVNADAADELIQNIGKEFYVDIALAPGQEGYKPKLTEKRRITT